MVEGTAVASKLERFAAPPWTKESEEWQLLDLHLPADHLARKIDRAVDDLDLGPLWDSYLGVGKKALRPDLLLKVVWYEMQSKRPSPAQWAKDVRESEPVRWLLFGMEPSRARLYDFRERLAPSGDAWNAQTCKWLWKRHDLRVAGCLGWHDAWPPTLRGGNSSIEERLQKRRELIEESLQHVRTGRNRCR